MYQNSWLSCFFLILTLIMIHQTATTTAQITHYCLYNTIFNDGSPYQTNLNTLFRNLVSNATNNPSGFYRTTVGNPKMETIYGQYLCTGDHNISSCHECVNTATTRGIPNTCPNLKVVIIWYEACMVRYSNKSFFNSMDRFPALVAWNVNNIIGDTTRFMDSLANMVNKIALRASRGGPVMKFATDFVNYSVIQPIYASGQCTPDLTPNDCYQCLSSSIQDFKQNPGGRVFVPSCIVRFECYPFFNLSHLQVALPPSPSPSPSSSLSPSPSPLSLPSSVPVSIPIPVTTSGSNGKKKISTKVLFSIVIAALLFLLFISAALCLISICLLKNKARKLDVSTYAETRNQDFTTESLQYDLATLLSATSNFSDKNKVGEGGFGGVYKGTLTNGKLIAVKRLSTSSSQGIREFETEVLLVAKLQHRNLVRLLGFCYTEQEKLLVYEYVPNKSLDNFIFDHENRQQLSWQKRYNIIIGIARGLLYLHHDSQLRIIHRDLKASNVLLDEEMNAKISDFGTSRIFGVDQSLNNYTNKVVGTYGYMAPEYALQGQFSIKSDVYSFGVLILEIISGKRASNFYSYQSKDDTEDLITHAWKHWEAGTPIQFVDPTIRDSCSDNIEVVKCIQLGLLCVQESVEDRPTMANTFLTLESYTVTLPIPEQPGFGASAVIGSSIEVGKSIPSSVNDISDVTQLEPR